MKVVRTLLIGGIVSAGLMLMYTDKMEQSRKMLVKKGRKLLKRMA